MADRTVPTAGLLFNLGQCQMMLKDYQRAIFFFEGYLREETRPEPERRRLAEELITEARADLQRRMAATTVPAPASPPPPPPPARTLSLQATDTQRVMSTALVTSPSERDQPDPSGQRSITSRWWFWTAIAGACVVAAGAAVYYATGEPRLVPPPTSLGPYDAQKPGAP